jgi:hypothetical protein
MGKLLTGRYGNPPGAESTEIALRDCYQRLGMKPTDYVSAGEPKFFKHAFGATGRYLVFLVESAEIGSNPVWKPGYYLLPIDALDVLKTFDRKHLPDDGRRRLRVDFDAPEGMPADVRERANRFAEESQPLFFKCTCDHLEMKIKAPWGLRRRWKAQLKCPKRCQPALTATI